MILLQKFLILLLEVVLFYGCNSDGSTSTTAPLPDPGPDPTPALTDEELMDLVRERTFTYFFYLAVSDSGIARERSNENPLMITTGGSGFNLASFPAAVERGWINEQQAIERLKKC